MNSFTPKLYGGIESANVVFKNSVKPEKANGIVIIGRKTFEISKKVYTLSVL